MFWARSIACVVATAAIVVACAPWEIPAQRCRATAFSGEDAAVASPSAAPCAACVNAQCCDQVGRCDETAGCTGRVNAARTCLLEAGAAAGREEPLCRSHLEADQRAIVTYDCMRRSCGGECQIPSCDVTSAAAVVLNGPCDRCVTASCCPQINTCYGNRGCKLALECIVGRCGSELGNGLARAEMTDVAPAACNDAGGIGTGQGGPGGCIGACIDEFGANRGDFESACRAFDVFQCAAKARCGKECLVPDAGAGIDAGTGVDATTD
jgi:hypothetical protein